MLWQKKRAFYRTLVGVCGGGVIMNLQEELKVLMKLLNGCRTKNMSIKLSNFLDINDINFEENSIFRELVKVSVVEENLSGGLTMNLQDEIKELKQRIVELGKLEKQEQEFPQYDDKYWYVRTDGEIFISEWDGFSSEEGMLEIGNVYKTKEQAEFVVEKLKVETELRKFSRPFKDNDNNYFMKIDSIYNTIVIYDEECYQTQGVIYFESEKKAEGAIQAVGGCRIKKYIFGED